ncbi:MAG TPA: Ppx/GppA phosphatase family protein [Stenotrophobium sp.]|jgi:exopolyphosphatase/guanosine-5'-triphosphate,3'-diphosphate pyrophosphatase|nr:Ppx/GppA phosphatase family protein [Stenotrophobium sp.]
MKQKNLADPAADSTEVAAVDLGSNSFHMLVARSNGHDLQVIDRLREPVRLAAGLDPDKRLRADTQARALACLQRFGQRLRGIPADRVRAVGTNTMRRLRRGSDFMAAAEIALGHDIEVISGVEEARMVYAGVTQGMGSESPRRLIVDIGGGSTEVIIGEGSRPRLMESVSLGCVVHNQRFFDNGDISRGQFRKARLSARMELEFLERRYRKAGWDIAIGSSGTVRGAWRVMMEQGWCEQAMTREGLEKVIDLVIARGDTGKLDFPALREDRRPVFAGGLAVLAGVFDALQIERMETSERALRDGLIYDLLGRLSNQDVRAESVAAMAARYDVDLRHAQKVEHTALAILEQTAANWELDPKISARLLGWAARLHEIGLVIAHTASHKHGEYILKHCDLQGFSQTDQKLLAALVRVHRGKFALAAFDELPSLWVEPLRRLAMIFRLAVLLHRARMPEFDPPVRVVAGRRSLEISFGQSGWLAQHPLTLADLEREADYLKAIEVKLKVT